MVKPNGELKEFYYNLFLKLDTSLFYAEPLTKLRIKPLANHYQRGRGFGSRVDRKTLLHLTMVYGWQSWRKQFLSSGSSIGRLLFHMRSITQVIHFNVIIFRTFVWIINYYFFFSRFGTSVLFKFQVAVSSCYGGIGRLFSCLFYVHLRLLLSAKMSTTYFLF